MAGIVFEDLTAVLVVVHALAAMVLIGASTHQAIIVFGYLRGVYKSRLGRIYAATVLVSYLVTFALGAAAYPAFRYHTRALYLDRYQPWASNLFDVKEHFASLGLPLVIGVFVLSRVLEPKSDRSLLPGYAVLSFGVAAIVWFNVIAGLVVTLARGMA